MCGPPIDHHRDQRAVAQPEKIRLIGRLWIIGWFFGNGDALDQRMGLLDRQDRRLAFLDRVARAPNGMGRIRGSAQETEIYEFTYAKERCLLVE